MLRLPVHPHIRGVYVEEPPHRQPPIRSIPTYVGFTASPEASTRPGPVHPHIRGVYSGAAPLPQPAGRSIPTYVGFTARPTVGSSASTGPSPHTWGLRSGSGPRGSASAVHPHIRGVYTEIKSKISRASSKTALLPAEKFKILFLVKIKSSAAAFQVHTIFRDQFPPGLHFEIALHL